MAGDDVETLPAPERPTCPYEQTQFDTAVTDTFAVIAYGPTRDPFLGQLARHTALVQVMLTRAATALREVQMTETTEATGDAYQMKTTKPSAYLQAFLRLSSEYRRYLQIIQTHLAPTYYDPELIEHTRRSRHDTSLTPEDQQALERTEHPADRIARPILNDAQQAARDGCHKAAIDKYNRVARLAPALAAPLYEQFKATSDHLLQTLPTAHPIIDRTIIGDEK